MSDNLFLRRASSVLVLGVAAMIAFATVGGVTGAPTPPLDIAKAAAVTEIEPPVAEKEQIAAAPASVTKVAVASTPAIQAQLDYALAHWNNYNLEQFGDLNSVGGDCQNFVSQTLLARGWTMDADWYSYDGGYDWSAAWGYVPAFDEYLRAHPERGATIATLDERSTIKIGDLVMFDWEGNGALDHIQVVSSITDVDGVISIGMAGHNNDTDYRDLDATITVDHPGAYNALFTGDDPSYYETFSLSGSTPVSWTTTIGSATDNVNYSGNAESGVFTLTIPVGEAIYLMAERLTIGGPLDTTWAATPAGSCTPVTTSTSTA